MPRTRKRKLAEKRGLRSGFELEVAQMLDLRGVKYEYEREKFPWKEELPNGYCPACGERAVADRSYTPDFFLENGVIIEAKGRFTPKDRKIAVAMKKAGIDVKLIFQFNNKLSRASKTRYSDWCEKRGIDFAIRTIPEEWINNE